MMDKNRYRIGKTFIAITNTDDTVSRILHCIKNGRKGYVCISNMRTVTIANREPAYRDVMNRSLFNTPDGTPLVWCARAWGLKQVQRTCGPHLFRALLKTDDQNLSHFFLGDTDETLKALTDKCQNDYGSLITGSYSPPFKPLEEYDIQLLAEIINRSGANIVWTSLRAPKQDFLASMLLPYLKEGIVIVGVGAAFRFELGEYTPPEGKLQKVGLAGLRVKRKGVSLWSELRWYIKHVFYLLGYLVTILLKRLTGKHYYE